MKIKVNGNEEIISEDSIILSEYLKTKNIRPDMVAVELNSKIVGKKDYTETQIKDNDTLEIVKFVGGGG